MRHRNSRYSDIPLSFINVTKSIVTLLLISLMISDLFIMTQTGDEVEIFSVQYVSTGIKIATFVSESNSNV